MRRPSRVRELPCVPSRAATRRVTPAILGATQPGKALLPIDELIPYLLRKAGGRMAASRLQFELRWRGILPELAAPALKNLGERAVMRVTRAGEAAYELTAHGWDAVICSSKAMTRRGAPPTETRVTANVKSPPPKDWAYATGSRGVLSE